MVNVFDKYIRCSARSSISNYNNIISGRSGGSNSISSVTFLVGLRLAVLGFGDGRDTTNFVGFEVVGRVVVVIVVVIVGTGEGDGHTSVTGSADVPIDLGTSGSQDMHDNDVQP